MGVLYQNGLHLTKARNLKDVLDKVLQAAKKLTESPAAASPFLSAAKWSW